MKLKSELYKEQQKNLSLKIINILGLNDENQFVLYELDNDKEKIDEIMSLIPEIRKYFSFCNIKGADSPHTLKRPYLSIIRQITKITHKMFPKDKNINIDGKIKKTRIFTFVKI